MEELLTLVTRAAQQNIDWPRLEAALPFFVDRMRRTEQDPQWHGEGDVWTHTKLVCERLVELEAFTPLGQRQREALVLAALLHDVGKAVTTRWEDFHWISPNHAPVGARVVRQFLWEALSGTKEKREFRETVCQLIRYHSLPAHAIDDPDGIRKLRSVAANGMLCPLFSVELLCLLSQADALGRVAADQAHMLEQVQLCRELAREGGCLEGPYAFPSEYTRFAYLSGRQVPAEVELYDDTWGTVYLLSGLPGTGKDTWIRENLPQLPMISLDDIRAELSVAPKGPQVKVLELAQARARQLLREKKSFIWNATNLTVLTRQSLIGFFTDYGAAVRIVYLETEEAQRKKRNAERQRQVPEEAVGYMLEQMVLPEAKEAHQVLWLSM